MSVHFFQFVFSLFLDDLIILYWEHLKAIMRKTTDFPPKARLSEN